MQNFLMETKQFNNKDLYELQKLFRTGKIKEKDITEQQRDALKRLYHQQIDFLQNSIENDKQKIIRIKKQLQS